jgi:amidase
VSDDLLFRPATELAELVRSGEVSSRELVEESLERIEAVDGDVNAFTHTDAEGALAAADAVQSGDERPFAGVPIAIKDLGMAVAGWPLTNCSKLYEGYVPDYDGYVTRRIKEAGFVLVGRTASPEFGIVPVTESRMFGPTRNPWDLGRTPGGSSGGSGAAVAAGMVPIAHASDGGGSIRIPAACNGLVGLKAARGRISRGPEFGDSFLATDGTLCRTMADTAATLDLLAGYEPGDATWAPPPDAPFAEAVGRDPGKLRIGFTTTPPMGRQPDPENVRAAEETAQLLESLGHEVTPFEHDWNPDEIVATFVDLWAGMVSIGVGYALTLGRQPSPENVEPLSWALFEKGLALSSTQYLGSLTRLQQISRELIAHWSDIDVLLTPALGQRQVEIGTIDACREDDPMLALIPDASDFTPYTAVWNVTGQPAISLPLFQGEDGLPTAVQLVGPPIGEETLLSLGAQLEAERPWADRRPELVGGVV